MRPLAIVLLTIWSLAAPSRAVWADCFVIDQLDKLHSIQTRLARAPSAALYASDIRQLRLIVNTLGQGDISDAIDGNSVRGEAATLIRLLGDTRALLGRVSLDDPNSARAHFTPRIRERLGDATPVLAGLRCSRDQIEIDGAAFAARATVANTDAQDLADVAETLSTIADEVLQWRTLVVLGALGGGAVVITPMIKSWLILRKRRAKRHNTLFKTVFRLDQSSRDGSLIDINSYGTKLRHDLPEAPQPGSAVDIDISGINIKGTVIWSNAHYCGIQFKSRITLDQVAIVCASQENDPGSDQMMAQNKSGTHLDAASS